MQAERILENCVLKRVERKEDARGALIALETGREVPFAIERAYFLFDTTEGSERGFHAHRALSQLAVCVAGACTIIVDDGRQRREVRLDSPDQNLLMGPMLWREMRDFEPGNVLMVLASAHYDESDYIRDYDEFLTTVRQGEAAGA